MNFFIYEAMNNCFGIDYEGKLIKFNKCNYDGNILNGFAIYEEFDNGVERVIAADLNISKGDDYVFFKDFKYKKDINNDSIINLEATGVYKQNNLTVKFIANIKNNNQKDISLAPNCFTNKWFDVKPYIDNNEGEIIFEYIGENNSKGYYKIGDENSIIEFNNEIIDEFDSTDEANDKFYQILEECD